MKLLRFAHYFAPFVNEKLLNCTFLSEILNYYRNNIMQYHIYSFERSRAQYDFETLNYIETKRNKFIFRKPFRAHTFYREIQIKSRFPRWVR